MNFDIPDDWILSRAHEVMENMPPSLGLNTCMRCGLVGTLEQMFRDPKTRCIPHWEKATSGWLPEDDGEKPGVADAH